MTHFFVPELPEALWSCNQPYLEYLVWSLLNRIDVLAPEQDSSNLSRLLDQSNIRFRYGQHGEHSTGLRDLLEEHGLAHVTPNFALTRRIGIG
jgi:hypothetical protein